MYNMCGTILIFESERESNDTFILMAAVKKCVPQITTWQSGDYILSFEKNANQQFFSSIFFDFSLFI